LRNRDKGIFGDARLAQKGVPVRVFYHPTACLWKKSCRFVKQICNNMNHSVVLFTLGAPEIIIIIALILLLFGGKKIPELMRGLGKGMKEFKNAQKEDDDKDTGKESEKDHNKD
jgi:sec-independent protein translocase protein TatA